MSIPKSRLLPKDPLLPQLPLLVHGQGVFLFDAIPDISPTFFSILNKKGDNGLRVEFGKGYVHVQYKRTNEPLIDPSNTRGLSSDKEAYYWFSIDNHNQMLYAGIGEARLETAIYRYKLPHFAESFLESLVLIQPTSVHPRKLLRDPITRTVPLLVKDKDELSMMDVARGSYMPKANLSPTAQKLYECVAGKKFVLDDAEFPEFSRAIQHSIQTPGCWCNRRLAEKATEFSKDPKPLETYLRITLGENNGESPGVPYVMEIWPVGHYSPVHGHADANAVIRVLHGSIHVRLFPYLSSTVNEFGAADFKQGDITWISPTLNQVHQLVNLPSNKDACITIQCYMYDETNKRHYDYFDYLDDAGMKQKYTPDSDMEFIAFKELMKREWQQLKN